jgi:hypothetical protein
MFINTRNKQYNNIHLALFISNLTIIVTVFADYQIINHSTYGIGLAILSILINVKYVRLKSRELITLYAFAVYCLIVLSLANSHYHIFQNIRYWFGVIIYILFFITLNNTNYISIIFFRIMCTSVLFESILINFIINSSLLHGASTEIHKLQADGLYERPIGFTGNPGTTGVFLIILLYFIEKYNRHESSKYDLLLLLITILSLVSTTGIIVLLMYIMLKLFNKNILSKKYLIKVCSYLILIIIPFLLLMLLIDVKFVQKFSIKYVVYIIELKLDMLTYSEDLTLLGRQIVIDYPITSGDFGLLNFIDNMGIAGFILGFLVIISFNRGGKKYLPILLLFAFGSLHYPSMYQPAGQVLTAMILILGNTDFKNRYQ